MPKTFIHDGVEVKYTGRIAKKQSTLSQNKQITLMEIVPADPEALSFKKWVKEEDLYVVEDSSQPTP